MSTHDKITGQVGQYSDQPGAATASVSLGTPSQPPATEPGFNEKVLFWASFLTLVAAGIGFSVRGAILLDWGQQFGFTQGELGTITGGGLVGFGISIILFSFIADRIGYAPLMVIAFLLHVSSAVVTFLATPLSQGPNGKDTAFYCLNIGMWLFALGNGTCEAVINPLTASLFPRNKTHWLNILHAGWPGGLVLGALLGLGFNLIGGIRWEIKLGTFLIPTLLYGLLMLGRKFPRSEASLAGVNVGTMLLEFASPILLSLVLLQALVGYVELGTDSWIINITETILSNANLALLAFIWTNVLMFTLRFFAGPIVHKISPLGLLLLSAILGTTGLVLLGQSSTAWMWLGAVTIYGIGKTFYWPTMLGVVSERFPRGGALTLGVVGGVGMLSAGLLGGPGIGYKQDLAAMQYLTSNHEDETYKRYAGDAKSLYGVTPTVAGLDNSKVGVLMSDGKMLDSDKSNLEKAGRDWHTVDSLVALDKWWADAKQYADKDREPIVQARLSGGKKALTWTAFVPGMMALGYLLLVLYFRSQGGYQAEVLTGHGVKDDEQFTGGTEGPGEG
jgi:MFS family permease